MKTLLLFVCILCCGVQIYSQYPQRYDLHSYNTEKSGNIQIVLYNPNPFLYKRDVTIAGIVTDTSTDNMSSITAILPSAVPLADFTEQVKALGNSIMNISSLTEDMEKKSLNGLEEKVNENVMKRSPHAMYKNIFEGLLLRCYDELSRRREKVRTIARYKELISSDINAINNSKNKIIENMLTDSLSVSHYTDIQLEMTKITGNVGNINRELNDLIKASSINNDTLTNIEVLIKTNILLIIMTDADTYEDIISFVQDTYKEITDASEKINTLHDTIVKTIKEYQATYQKQGTQLQQESIMLNKIIKSQNPKAGNFIYTFETGNLDEIEVIVETSAKKDTVFPSSYGLVTHNYMPTRVEVYHILLTGRARISFNPQLYAGGIFTPSVYYRETYDQAMGTYRYARETHTAFEIGVMTNMNLMWRLSKCFGMGVGIGAGVNLPVSGHVPVNLRLGGSVSFLFGRYDRFSLNAYFLAGVIRRGIDRNIDEAMDYTGPQAFSYVNGMGLGAGIGLGINIYKYRKNTELAKRTF